MGYWCTSALRSTGTAASARAFRGFPVDLVGAGGDGAEHFDHFTELEGLADPGCELALRFSGYTIGLTGDEDEPCVGARGTEFGERLVDVGFDGREVDQGSVDDRPALEQGGELACGADSDDLSAPRFEPELEQGAHVFVVLEDEYAHSLERKPGWGARVARAGSCFAQGPTQFETGTGPRLHQGE